MTAGHSGLLSIDCQSMPRSRHDGGLAWLQPGGRPLTAGEHVRPHRHDQNQLVYAASGVLAVTTPAGTWVVPSQRAVWVPAGAEHAHRAHGPTLLRTLMVPVDAAFGRTGPAIIDVTPLLRELILTLVDDPPADADRRRRLEQVTVDQLRPVREPPLRLPNPADDRLRTVDAILRSDPGGGHPLADLAAAAGSSPRTLQRLCRRELGISLGQWRTELRVVHALALLADGHAVTTTAHRCGWANPSDFIAVFQAAVGVTPGQYRAGLNIGRHPGRAG